LTRRGLREDGRALARGETMTKLFGRPAGWLVVFGALSLVAVGLGAWVGAASGVPSGVWIRNLAAWAVGAVAAGAITAFLPPRGSLFALVALQIGVPASLFFADIDGVRRWIDIGPIHLNAAMLLMPAAAVALAARRAQWDLLWYAPLLVLMALAAQPDASQATTLAVLTVLTAAVSNLDRRARIGVIVAAVLLAGFAWTRPDPLAPVPEVEGIIGLAFALSPFMGGMALLTLAAVAGAPVLATRRQTGEVRLAGAALGLCLLVWAIMPFLGAFPVPLVGMGMSPIIGAWLGAGLLGAVLKRGELGTASDDSR